MLNKQKQNLFLGLLTLVLGFYLAFKTLVAQKIVPFFPWPLGFYENIKNPFIINGIAVLTIIWIVLTCYLCFKLEKHKIKYLGISFLGIILLHSILLVINSIFAGNI